MKPKILLIGHGKMGGAMLSRWKELKLSDHIYIVEPSMPGHALQDVPASFTPDVIIFAVKPQTLPDIIKDYARYTGALNLSIAAGTPISFFEKNLGANAKVVRAMPNTPASIGKGITVACANKAAAAEKELAGTLLSAVGEVMWLDNENLLNPVTALSGSGPAYVFLLIEVLEKAGIKIGLAPDMAKKLARQTVIGSAALAEASPDTSASELRKNVTSPGGTTQAALDVLLPSDLQKIFDTALEAATKRAAELAK